MDEQNNLMDKWLAIVKGGLILAWYYGVSLIVSSAVYARLKDINLYKAYVALHQNKLMIVIYLMLFFGIWAFDRHKAEFLAYFKGINIGAIFKYMIWAVGAYIICITLTNLLLPIFPDYEEIGSVFEQNQYVLSFISTVLLAPVVEEYIFRHKLRGYLKKICSASLAIIFQALLFGVLHTYTIQKIYAFLMGTFFGVVDEQEESVLPSIIMHLMINGIGWYVGCFVR